MENSVLTAFLIFLVCCLPSLCTFIGIDNVGRPIVSGALVGLILGDLETGIICGANIELIWLGVFAIGASNPPDMTAGTVLGTAYVILTSATVESAVLLAVPVATAGKLIGELRWTVIDVALGHKADSYALEGNTRGVQVMHWAATAISILFKPIVIALAFYFGIDLIEGIVAAIPTWLTDGMMYATGIIPAIGFALIARMIMSKETVLFLILGFALASFFNLSTIAIAVLACIIVAYQIFNNKRTGREVVADDNEF